MSSTSALYQLGRSLRYRSLPALIGQRVRLTSLADLEPALRALTMSWLPADARWEGNEHLEGALAKYGLVDTELAAPVALLDHATTQRGIEVLRTHGFLPRRGETWNEPDDKDLMLGCLADFADDFDPADAVLKLFLEDNVPAELRLPLLRDAIANNRPLVLPAAYFPRELAVTDACVTNARFIWFNDHFYM